MFSLLKIKKLRQWCLFDFGISSYPTLILTFFYGAFYANNIAKSPNLGTSQWGFSISMASILSFILFAFIIIQGRKYTTKIKPLFFSRFFIILLFSSLVLVFFDQDTNPLIPLIFVIISFISFEVVNLFYNLCLHKVAPKNKEGITSNLGWAFGYAGGLIALFIVYLIIKSFESNQYKVYDFSIFLLIGPFVGLWAFFFGYFHIKNFKNTNFSVPSIINFLDNLKSRKLKGFLFSFFFFNNGIICIFAFASMFASFIFNLSEAQILLLGIFINLFGIIGCLILGKIDDSYGSDRVLLICIVALFLLTLILFFISKISQFWIVAIMIGFFVGPIQASSRSLLAKKISTTNQLSAFCTYSMLGNLCAILGPLLVGLVIEQTDSIKKGLLVIPLFFLISLIPYCVNKYKNF